MDEWMQNWGLWGLFASAFISSTLLPGGSEVVLLTLAYHDSYSPVSLLAIATAGNALGGMSSWAIGWWLARRYPPEHLKPDHQRAVARVRRWGRPILLLSWLPVVGDPLCVAAGWLRIHPLWSLLLIALGKGGRYAVLLWLGGQA